LSRRWAQKPGSPSLCNGRFLKSGSVLHRHIIVAALANDHEKAARPGANREMEKGEMQDGMPAPATKPPRSKPLSSIHAEVAKDMIRFADERRAELTPTDFAAMSRWRSLAALQMCSWGVVTSAVTYMGARLAVPRGPLPTSSKAITIAAFLFGSASALPSTAPQLIHDAERLPTPFGQAVRDSIARHATSLARPALGSAPGSSAAPDGVQDAPPSLSAPSPGTAGAESVNQWGDPVFKEEQQ
jgi:hypothetical protein